MRVMTSIRQCLFAAVGLASLSLQDSPDPLNNFCRRWGHQTARVDNRLYIDGGLVATNPVTASPNYTNSWLLYSDLNSSRNDMPIQYNLTKASNVPSVSGGILWADEVNKCFYLYGGQYSDSPSDFSFWAYDTVLNRWNETKYKSNVNSIQRVSYGAGTQINELGMGFYYGGWLNNHTVPGWGSNAMATNSLIKYDFTSGTLTNNTGPDSVGRAEGAMVYVPASDGGLLVYFGGVEDPNQNGTFVGANMSTIRIFDVRSSKWYTQATGGTAPPMRRQFCAGVTWADDRSSYNIYLYGGFGVDSNNVTAFDDAYILTLPSFNWIKVFPADNSTTSSGHGGCSANVINKDQMLIIGGWFPNTNDCDSPAGNGQHNMNLGYNGQSNTLWDKYDPKLSSYFVPTPIVSVIGGGPTGGARATRPATWGHDDLAVYFSRSANFAARSATRTIPSGTASPSGGGSPGKSHIGAIAGGVVGGLVGLIAILCLVLFCLNRRKKAIKANATPSPPPAELAGTSPIHEMAAPGAAKYISMQQHAELYPQGAFSNPTSVHSRSPDEQHAMVFPYPPGADPSLHGNSPATRYSYQQTPTFPPYSDSPNAYDSQASSYDPNAYPRPSNHLNERQYTYPTPTSPSNSSFHQQPQVYYPPPPDPTTRSTYDDSTEPRMPPSASQTPAHFYAQPVMSGGSGLLPGSRGGEGGSMSGIGDDGSSFRGSVDSRRRPIRGRFVEVDAM